MLKFKGFPYVIILAIAFDAPINPLVLLRKKIKCKAYPIRDIRCANLLTKF